MDKSSYIAIWAAFWLCALAYIAFPLADETLLRKWRQYRDWIAFAALWGIAAEAVALGVWISIHG